ncbi:uncharacterized protein LOC110202313 isoform X3 [Phascolarctos cinereus]
MMLRLILRNVTFIGLRMNLPPQQFSLERKDSSIIRSCRLSCRMELKADQLYKQKIIRGFCHLYDGQRRLLVPEASGNLSDAGLTFRHLTCFDCCFPYYFYWKSFNGKMGKIVGAFPKGSSKSSGKTKVRMTGDGPGYSA